MPEKMEQASLVETVTVERAGYLLGIHAREIGEAAVDLGAGRVRKGEPIDRAVGFIIHHKVGDRVEKGEPLFTIHANDAQKLEAAKKRVLARAPVERRPGFASAAVLRRHQLAVSC